MSTGRTPAEAAFVKLVQDARQETMAEAFSNHRFPDGYNVATQNLLDIIHQNGYVILDKDGNQVNTADYSLACGIWHKEQQ